MFVSCFYSLAANAVYRALTLQLVTQAAGYLGFTASPSLHRRFTNGVRPAVLMAVRLQTAAVVSSAARGAAFLTSASETQQRPAEVGGTPSQQHRVGTRQLMTDVLQSRSGYDSPVLPRELQDNSHILRRWVAQTTCHERRIWPGCLRCVSQTWARRRRQQPRSLIGQGWERPDKVLLSRLQEPAVCFHDMCKCPLSFRRRLGRRQARASPSRANPRPTLGATALLIADDLHERGGGVGGVATSGRRC